MEIHRIYPKYSDTSTLYHICSKIWTSTIHYPMLCLKIAGWVSNSVDPDEMPRSAASYLGLNCLLRPVCPNTYGKYGRQKYYLDIPSDLELWCTANKSKFELSLEKLSYGICRWKRPGSSYPHTQPDHPGSSMSIFTKTMLQIINPCHTD